MEIKNAPPVAPPLSDSGDGPEYIKVRIMAETTVKASVTGAMKDLRQAWAQAGKPLLGASISGPLCSCGLCPGTTYGLIVKASQEAESAIRVFALMVDGSIENTNDPELRIGVFDEVIRTPEAAAAQDTARAADPKIASSFIHQQLDNKELYERVHKHRALLHNQAPGEDPKNDERVNESEVELWKLLVAAEVLAKDDPIENIVLSGPLLLIHTSLKVIAIPHTVEL